MVKYRLAESKDIGKLSDIRCEFLIETNSGDITKEEVMSVKTECVRYFTRAISDKSFVAWIAEEEGIIIATSGICFFETPPNKSCPNGKAGFIQNMYTKEKYRGKGIAQVLFEKVLHEAKKRSCFKIMLNATDKGRHIYEKFGFKPAESAMHYCL